MTPCSHVDNRLSLLIPERRNGEAIEVVWVRLAVYASELCEVVQQILRRGAVTDVEDPAVLCELKQQTTSCMKGSSPFAHMQPQLM
jgi:hypothetical protein